MSCPFLYGRHLFSCNSMREVYLPSDFELEEYCQSTRHKLCPFYGRVAADGTFDLCEIRGLQPGWRL
jgi:hypothetical protein